MATVSTRMTNLILVLSYVPASKALHVLIQLVGGNTATCIRPLH